MIRDAYLMSDADGDIHPSEIDVINRFLRYAGIPEERFEEIEMWARESIAHLKRGVILFTKESLHPFAVI